MSWLKSHWKVLAALVVGYFIVYWVWRSYQAKQASAAQSNDLQSQTATDTAAYAQQIALGNINAGISGSGGGSFSEPVNTSTSVPVSTPETDTSSTPTLKTTSCPPGQVLAPNGVCVMPEALTPLTPYTGGVTPDQNSTTPTDTSVVISSKSPSLIGSLFGSRTRPPLQNTPADNGNPSAILAPVRHIGSGVIDQHQSILPTPSTYELASLGRGR